MNLGYMLHGGAPVKKRFKTAVAVTTGVGVPLMIGTTANPGLVLLPSTAVSAVTDCVGITLDTSPFTATPTATSPEGIVTVIINPDAIYRIRMSGSATAGALLTLTTNDVADATGVSVDKTGATGSGDPDPNSPDMIEGTIFCVSGNNKGQYRTITTTAATAASAAGVAFINPIGVGDEFILVPINISNAVSNLMWLGTNLTEMRQNIAAGSVGAIMTFTDFEIDWADTPSARRNSYVYGRFADHVYDGNTI